MFQGVDQRVAKAEIRLRPPPAASTPTQHHPRRGRWDRRRRQRCCWTRRPSAWCRPSWRIRFRRMTPSRTWCRGRAWKRRMRTFRRFLRPKGASCKSSVKSVVQKLVLGWFRISGRIFRQKTQLVVRNWFILLVRNRFLSYESWLHDYRYSTNAFL